MIVCECMCAGRCACGHCGEFASVIVCESMCAGWQVQRLADVVAHY